jgi:hypothetical protein
MIADKQVALAPVTHRQVLSAGRRLERYADDVLNRWSVWAIVAICGVCFLLTCGAAAEKIIWTDEFFTLYLSRLESWNQIYQALLTGGDQHPVWFYLTHRFFLNVFGENPLALRLPQVLGFLVMILCVYRFVARRTNRAYGIAAMTMPLLTVAHAYAYEARGYGLVLGYFGLAVLCWQQSGEPGRRMLPLAGLALGLSGAVASHYYAALLIPALVLAEVLRSIRRGRVAWGVWAAICAPAFVIAAAYPLLSAAQAHSAAFWAPATWTAVNTFYVTTFAPAITGIGAGLAAACLCLALLRVEPETVQTSTFQPEEIVLAVAIAAGPLVGVLFGKAVTGVFTWRYAIGSVIGLAILFGFSTFTAFRGSAACAAVVVAIAVAVFTIQCVSRVGKLRAERQNFQEMLQVLPAGSPESPLVVAQSDMFYKLTYYTPMHLNRHYIYLTDTEKSRRFLGQNTPDRSLAALAPWFGLPVRPYGSHIAAHPAMTVVTDLDPAWTWLPSALVEDTRSTVQVISRFGHSLVLSVRRKP